MDTLEKVSEWVSGNAEERETRLRFRNSHFKAYMQEWSPRMGNMVVMSLGFGVTIEEAFEDALSQLDRSANHRGN